MVLLSSSRKDTASEGSLSEVVFKGVVMSESRLAKFKLDLS